MELCLNCWLFNFLFYYVEKITNRKGEKIYSRKCLQGWNVAIFALKNCRNIQILSLFHEKSYLYRMDNAG